MRKMSNEGSLQPDTPAAKISKLLRDLILYKAGTVIIIWAVSSQNQQNDCAPSEDSD